MADDPNRREIAHWVQLFLAGDLSFERFFQLVPDDTEDEEVAELLDLVVHQPKEGGFMGAGPEEYRRHMQRIRDLVDLLAMRSENKESAWQTAQGAKRPDDREADGPISQTDADRVARLLGHDLLETIGRGHESAIEEAISRIRMFADEPADFEQRVVDDLQQFLHDMFVDTSWPACPEHPNHPLRYSDGWWKCAYSGRRVAPLGSLRRAAG
jgi:hypothetical protein